jgi:hypothetical protein
MPETWPTAAEMCTQIDEEARICFNDIKAGIAQRARGAS